LKEPTPVVIYTGFGTRPWPVTLGGAGLVHDLAGPPLRDTEPRPEHVRGPAAPRQAHQFLRDPQSIDHSFAIPQSIDLQLFVGHNPLEPVGLAELGDDLLGGVPAVPSS
jgi:hypothetical protein